MRSSQANYLKLGYYEESCPNAEKIVYDFVKSHIPNAPTLAAPLLRMHFHDCFVRGCDASVLINSTSENQAEKAATPNLSLRGFGFIDRIKSLLEEECPGVVSCADIVALTARDAVVTIGGPYWNVPTGRRDGLISKATEALNNIPSPTFNFSALQRSFASKGLDIHDLVLLSGAHTIGIAQCQFFSNRLHNFTGRGDQDPALDDHYAENLKKFKCKSPQDQTSIAEMDPGSFRTFDLGYYKLLLKRRGIFQSDAALFFNEFGRSMEKMGRVEVKTGDEGEIRKHCAAVNGYYY
ncbi:Peroxidase 3 [Apostasia shenzhenica]|uniref:Peroxidase n=1 Tax=Apostasia shenzhenica TaxID=1088818 RepID=A0A2H9ZSX8_9ASPA|nr:Peroxidase 3 [Apostasia shenzhenica]